MFIRAVRVCVGLAGLACASAAMAQPVNDTCSAAIIVQNNSTTAGTNFNANSDIFQTCSDLDSWDVWYRFTAPGAGSFTFDTIGSAIDTVLSLWSGCGGSILACNDDIDTASGNYDSQIANFAMTSGQTIVIRIAGYNLDEGPFVLRVTGASTPSGVCCRGTTCRNGVAQGACTGANSLFVSGGGACNAAGNSTTPCCKADFNKAGGITVQDVFDFLTAWFAGDSIADLTGNGAGTPGVQSVFDFLTAWFAGGC